MNHSRKILATLVLGMALVGCAGAKYEAAGHDEDPGQQKQDPVYERAACEIEYWDQSLDLNLWNYEFVSSNGGSFGFGKLGILNLFDLSFKVDKALLTMKVSPANPYERDQEFNVSADDKDVQFGIKIGFGDIALGFSNYSKTPVAKMVQSALMKAVEGISAKATKREWSTRVLKVPVDQRDRVIVQAAADAGITEGDEFEVWDIKYEWQGQACQSKFSGYHFPDDKPIAILQATKGVDSSHQFATLKIKDARISNVQIPVGSYIRQVPAAKGKKLKQLGRSIRINSAVSEDLILKDGRKVNLTNYLQNQVSDAIHDKKWKGLFYRYTNN